MQDWIKLQDQLPEIDVEVDGYNEIWKHKDYNPEGIRPCFLTNDNEWIMCIWDDINGEWTTTSTEYKHEVAPTHWRDRPLAPIGEEVQHQV